MALTTAPNVKAAAAPQIPPIAMPNATSALHHKTPTLTSTATTKNTTVDNITVPASLERILHPIVSAYAASVMSPTHIAAERSLTDNRSETVSPVDYSSCAKASRSWFSCSSGRLVEMISKS
jgi:hypothetical protein